MVKFSMWIFEVETVQYFIFRMRIEPSGPDADAIPMFFV